MRMVACYAWCPLPARQHHEEAPVVNMIAPKHYNLAPDLVKSYSPSENDVNTWHRVVNGHTESLGTIAKQYQIPAERLIEFNFPGSVINGRINPGIVNWYLFNHIRTLCRATTKD